jgi:hypothetical protein
MRREATQRLMPTLMLRRLSPELMARVKAYAAQKQIGVTEAAAQLLAVALDHLDARAAGAASTNAGRTPEERSAAAKRAAEARWKDKP